MFNLAKDTHSLAHFKRHTAQAMKQMQDSGQPIVLTVDGKAEVVVQDAAAYQRLMVLAEKAEMAEFPREAKADGDAGRPVPARKFLGLLALRQQPLQQRLLSM